MISIENEPQDTLRILVFRHSLTFRTQTVKNRNWLTYARFVTRGAFVLK